MALPPGYTFRPLEASDRANGYLDTLAVLTTVGEVSEAKFGEIFAVWSASDVYRPHVITDASGKVVATGMLLVEAKVIHEGGKVGHIEDISVAKSQQGKKLGLAMITGLTQLASEAGCYKVILDCSPHNVGFYEKCGYKNEGVEMAIRL